jgi:hypothetical protein
MAHLKGTNTAALLIRRRENGHLHWVAATGINDGKVTIIDSLREAACFEEPRAFLDECVVSCILVRPSGTTPAAQRLLNAAHAEGTVEMMKTLARYKRRGAAHHETNP